MRVGLVRNAAFGMVALVGLGLVGCDDSPTDFDSDQTVRITTNPSVMVVPAGVTSLLETRTENQGAEPTWEDVNWTVDASCGNGQIVLEEAATYEPSIQPPGQIDVTGGSVLGETCIQLSGGGAEAVVEVTVVGDSLEVVNAPATLNVNDTVQVSAALLSNAGDAVGPFDPLAEVTWTSDDQSVLTVDETGTVAAVGVGTATITGTYVASGYTATASATITVEAPAPDLISTDVASAAAGEVVTITGANIVAAAHAIFVDGFELDPILEPTIVDGTTATFRMPPGPNGDVGVQLGTPGDLSNTLTVTRTGDTEPANSDPGTAPMGTLPLDIWGVVDGTDLDDFFAITLAAPATLDLLLDWTTDADLDLLVVDGAFTAFQCGFVTATAAQPESGQCSLPAGDYLIWVNSYDAAAGTYRAQVSVAP